MRKLLLLFIFLLAFSGYGLLGEGCVCEKWVSEYRIDTIGLHNLIINDGGATAGVISMTIDWTKQRWGYYFDAAADRIMLIQFPEYLLRGSVDSVDVDSIVLQVQVTTAFAAGDTFVFKCDTTALIAGWVTRDAPTFQIDILVGAAAPATYYMSIDNFGFSQHTHTKYVFGLFFPSWAQAVLEINGVKLYYTAYSKRYGIPTN